MKSRVVVTWPDYRIDDVNTGGRLVAGGCEVVLAPRLGDRSPNEVQMLMADADAAIVSTDTFTAGVIQACPRLRVISRVGVGLDSIDLKAASECGVLVTTTPGANDHAAAEHTMSLMLAVVRRLGEFDRGVRAGRWDRTGPAAPWSLGTRTVALVGLGRIGTAVARMCLPFGARMIGFDPFAGPVDGVERFGLEEVLAQADLLSLHLPLVDSTRLLIGERELALLPDGALIVNTARGGIIDEKALCVALSDGRLAGAGLDVFDTEPPNGSPLLELSNVILTPHVAGLSVAAIAEMTERATSSVLAVLKGEPVPDLVHALDPSNLENP